jgi:preprotein translocase SecE subunit
MATLNQPSKKTAAKDARVNGESGSMLANLQQYCTGLKTEWTKISWPTKAQVWGQTIVVLVMVSMMTLILFIMDYSFHFIISNIVPHRI